MREDILGTLLEGEPFLLMGETNFVVRGDTPVPKEDTTTRKKTFLLERGTNFFIIRGQFKAMRDPKRDKTLRAEPQVALFDMKDAKK